MDGQPLSRRQRDFSDKDKRHNPQCKIAKAAISGQLHLDIHTNKLTWNVDLLKTQPYWPSWFEGMDDRFLQCTNPLLILSDREWLDERLLVASMQGKFQLSVIPDSGHNLQEDQPDLLADILIKHIDRLCKLRTCHT